MSVMSAFENETGWNNELVKEILWMLEETEDVIEDQMDNQRNKLTIKEKYSINGFFNCTSKLSIKEKLKERKIKLLVKKRLGYDIDYDNSMFCNEEVSDPETKIVYKDIAELCKKLNLPEKINEYIHLVIFSMIALKYLSDLEYIHRVNRGTVFREREFKANKFVYLRFKLHRYILNFALLSFHPFMIRFNKLRGLMKTLIDTKFYYINVQIEDYVKVTKTICKRHSINPKRLDPADQEELKSFYDECRIYLQENCFQWLETFKASVSGELCPDEYEDEEEYYKQFSLPPKLQPNPEELLQETQEISIILHEGEESEANRNMTDRQELLENVPEGLAPIIQPLFANLQQTEVSTRNWRILNPQHFAVPDDVASKTNSSRSEVFSDGLPSNNMEVASTSDTASTSSGSAESYPGARKMPRLY